LRRLSAILAVCSLFASSTAAQCPGCNYDEPNMPGHGSAGQDQDLAGLVSSTDSRRVITVKIDSSFNISPGQTNPRVWNATNCAISGSASVFDGVSYRSTNGWNNATGSSGSTSGYYLKFGPGTQGGSTADIIITNQAPSNSNALADTTGPDQPHLIRLTLERLPDATDVDLCALIKHEMAHGLGLANDDSCDSIMNAGRTATGRMKTIGIQPADVDRVNFHLASVPSCNRAWSDSLEGVTACGTGTAVSTYNSFFTGPHGESCTQHHQVSTTTDCHGAVVSTSDDITSTECATVCWISSVSTFNGQPYYNSSDLLCRDVYQTLNYQCNNNASHAPETSVVGTNCAAPCEDCALIENCVSCDPQACACTHWDPGTPIIVDVRGDGYELAGISDTVSFDLHASGKLMRTTWTAVGTDDAFLVLDRNGNGVVDDGRELFGNATPLADGSPAPNGWVALAVLDDPAHGGNGDGILDARDQGFAALRLWQDRNHNAFSEPDELITLSDAGITGFDLNYKVVGKKDKYGNLFRYRAEVIRADDRHSYAYDVVFTDRRQLRGNSQFWKGLDSGDKLVLP
jgi:hypothetical protein